MRYSVAFLSASFAALALAKTDLEGCTTTDVSSPAGASVAWYVPGTGELCDPLDCGGGRAPPKTTVPGCPQYSGTASYSPSYLPGYSAEATGAASTSAPSSDATPTTSAAVTDAPASESSSSSFDWSAAETDTAITSFDLYTETTAGASTVATPSSAAVVVPESSSAVSTAVVQTTVAGAGSNGTAYSTGRPGSGSGGSNSTVGNGTSPSTTASIAGAAQTAWVGSAGFVIGLGALVAAL